MKELNTFKNFLFLFLNASFKSFFAINFLFYCVPPFFVLKRKGKPTSHKIV